MNRKTLNSLLFVPLALALANAGSALAQTPGTIAKFDDQGILTDSVITEDPGTCGGSGLSR